MGSERLELSSVRLKVARSTVELRSLFTRHDCRRTFESLHVHSFLLLVGPEGLEPSTNGVRTRCSAAELRTLKFLLYGVSVSDDQIQCPHCERTFNKHGIKSHIWRAHGAGQGFQPIKPGTLLQPGRLAWNRGRTALSDPRIRGPKGIVPWNTGRSKETDERLVEVSRGLSETVKRKVKEGTWHVSYTARRTHEYRGVKLLGSWELAYAKWLDAQGIQWVRPTESFPYVFGNKERRYTPDFYLPDTDQFVEVKGYEKPMDHAKWREFPRRLKIVREDDLRRLHLI